MAPLVIHLHRQFCPNAIQQFHSLGIDSGILAVYLLLRLVKFDLGLLHLEPQVLLVVQSSLIFLAYDELCDLFFLVIGQFLLDNALKLGLV